MGNIFGEQTRVYVCVSGLKRQIKGNISKVCMKLLNIMTVYKRDLTLIVRHDNCVQLAKKKKELKKKVLWRAIKANY